MYSRLNVLSAAYLYSTDPVKSVLAVTDEPAAVGLFVRFITLDVLTAEEESKVVGTSVAVACSAA